MRQRLNQRLNLANRKYGKLTAIKDIGRNKHGQRKWLCKCSCGNETITTATSLNLGKTQSCGCVQNENRKDMWKRRTKNKPRANLTGQVFGELTAKKMLPGLKWLCQCSCGNETTPKANNLLSGNSTSCGCIYTRKKADITLKKFGLLTAIKPSGYTKNRCQKWECKCDCGNTTVINGVYLRSGETKSCGCLTPMQNKEYAQTEQGTLQLARLTLSSKNGAKYKDIPKTLVKAQAIRIQINRELRRISE